jgi:hypothetical protein
MPIERSHERRIRALGYVSEYMGEVPRWLVLVENQRQTQPIGHLEGILPNFISPYGLRTESGPACRDYRHIVWIRSDWTDHDRPRPPVLCCRDRPRGCLCASVGDPAGDLPGPHDGRADPDADGRPTVADRSPNAISLAQPEPEPERQPDERRTAGGLPCAERRQ